MRITFGSGDAAALADLERAQAELQRYQRQVSSGKRLLQPSDDPSAMAAVVRGRGEIATVDQYVRSADSVTSRLTVVDTVMSDLISQVTTARSAAVAGQGTTQTTQQREATAQQLEGLRDAIFDDLNTTFRGTYLFSGSASLTPPFARLAGGSISGYSGNNSPISVDIDKNKAIQVTFDGGSLDLAAGGPGLFANLQTLIAAVRTGDQAGMANGLASLEQAFNEFTRVQSGVGAALNGLDDQRRRLNEMKLSSQARLSKEQDANMAEAITGMQQANTTYQAALGAVSTRTRLSLLDYLK
ncbi:MAG TPA: flagellar hook-associated protein FlgL [Vicinamibacterales bacterium]|jgi:flagellar hook-associated protein 3 FlgL